VLRLVYQIRNDRRRGRVTRFKSRDIEEHTEKVSRVTCMTYRDVAGSKTSDHELSDGGSGWTKLLARACDQQGVSRGVRGPISAFCHRSVETFLTRPTAARGPPLAGGS